MHRKNDKRYWTEEDWDNSNIIRYIFKKITGMTLDNQMLKLLIVLAISSAFCTYFLN